MAYPEGLLKTRAVIRPGEYAVIPPEGRVRNVIPGIEDCNMSILASPKLGASFVHTPPTPTPAPTTSSTSPFLLPPLKLALMPRLILTLMLPMERMINTA